MLLPIVLGMYFHCVFIMHSLHISHVFLVQDNSEASNAQYTAEQGCQQVAQRDEGLTVVVGIHYHHNHWDEHGHDHRQHHNHDHRQNHHDDDQRHTLCLCNTTLCNTHKNDISGSTRYIFSLI